MNPACLYVSVWINERQRHAVVFANVTYTEARDDFSICRLNEDINYQAFKNGPKLVFQTSKHLRDLLVNLMNSLHVKIKAFQLFLREITHVAIASSVLYAQVLFL